jgi:hypothetical protein
MLIVADIDQREQALMMERALFDSLTADLTGAGTRTLITHDEFVLGNDKDRDGEPLYIVERLHGRDYKRIASIGKAWIEAMNPDHPVARTATGDAYGYTTDDGAECRYRLIGLFRHVATYESPDGTQESLFAEVPA